MYIKKNLSNILSLEYFSLLYGQLTLFTRRGSSNGSRVQILAAARSGSCCGLAAYTSVLGKRANSAFHPLG